MTTEAVDNSADNKMFTFTFGSGQECRCGRTLGSRYTHVEATDELAARERMASLWGANWCGCYASDGAAGVDEYGLKRIVCNFDDSTRCPCSRGPQPDYVLVALECSQCCERAGALVLPRSAGSDALAQPKLAQRMICERCRDELRRAP